MHNLYRILISLFILSLSVFAAVTFVIRPVKINDDGMSPTFSKDSYILVNVFNKTTEKISVDDVVVFKDKDSYKVRRIASQFDEGKYVVKTDNQEIEDNQIILADNIVSSGYFVGGN